MIDKMMVIGFSFVYLVVIMAIGIAAMLRPQNTESFFLGGRKTNASILALTFSSTSMSGLLFLGFSGMIYEQGLQGLWVIIPSSTIGIVLSYKMISVKVRQYSEYTGALTIIELLKKRYIDENHTLIFITGFMTLAATIMYVSGQLIAAGKLINLVIGFDYNYSVLIFATIIVSYTALGGFTAVCWTDVFQGILMVLGSLIAGLVVMKISGGWEPLWLGIKVVSDMDPKFKATPFSGYASIILGVTTFFGDGIMNWIGQPTLMTKYMTARNNNILLRAEKMSVVFQIILFSGVLLCSLYMRINYITPSELPLTGDVETIFIQFFIAHMNPFLGGIILGGIIAAIMSTADSLLLLTSSVLVNDIYSIRKPNASAKQLIFMSKITTVLLGVIVVFIAFNAQSVLITAWIGWTVLGIVGIPVITGLYWEGATLKGAIWSQIIGFTTLIIWVAFDLTQLLGIFYAFAAGTLSYLTIIVVSLYTEKSPLYIQREVSNLKNNFKFNSHIKR